MKYPEQLTPAEYGIIEILWDSPSALSVSQVLEILRLKKSIAYTTTMTLLDKMARKGSLKRVKKGKAYYYRPHVRRSGVLSFVVQQFTDQYFDGQKEKLVTFVQKRNSSLARQLEKPESDTPKREKFKKNEALSKQVQAPNNTTQEIDICLL